LHIAGYALSICGATFLSKAADLKVQIAEKIAIADVRICSCGAIFLRKVAICNCGTIIL
jgi:hypothetical protein